MCAVARGTSLRCLFLAFARLVRRKDVSRNLHETAAFRHDFMPSRVNCTGLSLVSRHKPRRYAPNSKHQLLFMKKCSKNFSLCRCPCISRVELQQASEERKKSSRCGLRTSLSSFFFIVLCIKFMGRQIEKYNCICSGFTALLPAHGCIRNFPRRRLPCSCKLPFLDKKWVSWEWEWGLKGCGPGADSCRRRSGKPDHSLGIPTVEKRWIIRD